MTRPEWLAEAGLSIKQSEPEFAQLGREAGGLEQPHDISADPLLAMVEELIRENAELRLENARLRATLRR